MATPNKHAQNQDNDTLATSSASRLSVAAGPSAVCDPAAASPKPPPQEETNSGQVVATGSTSSGAHDVKVADDMKPPGLAELRSQATPARSCNLNALGNNDTCMYI